MNVVLTDFLDPTAIQATVDGIAAPGPIDVVLIAHGCRSEQNQCQNDLRLCREVLNVNSISPALFAEAFAGHLVIPPEKDGV
jgi:hypothetical protein